MVGDATPPVRALAEHGVARVSYGPGPYLRVMKALEQAARAASGDANWPAEVDHGSVANVS
jgi:2-methylisocitrate lyase-like PEP mutase family enzyme